MRRLFLKALLVLFGFSATAAPAWGFVQEKTPAGVPVRWNLAASQPNVSGGKVVYVINKRGSDDLAIASLTTAVDNAFAAWRLVNSSVIDFNRVVDPSTDARGTLPNRADQVNVVYWDEDPRNKSVIPGLTFVRPIRTVDLTPGNEGVILDVDIILNAFQFKWIVKTDDNFTSLTGPADVQSVMTTAVGSLMGLNEVPTMGSVMEKFDFAGNTTRRSLTDDERAAALDIYPPGSPPALTSISGQVTRAAQPVFGAYSWHFRAAGPWWGQSRIQAEPIPSEEFLP